jgi:hypothetical protein
MTTSNPNKVFDYRALRALMGAIAFTLPFIVSLIAAEPLSSISASYHTEARDIFVGLIFVVSAFLMAYNGHTTTQARVSKVASLAAALAALCPTSCHKCGADLKSIIHYIAAAVLFGILAYFCLGPFREKTKGQTGKKGLRAKIYFVCGWIIILCMLVIGLTKLTLSDDMANALRIVYWAEAVALGAFGVAWIVAGKFIPPLVDEKDALKIKL